MGRKKTYDRAETAERALQAFWEKGYTQTSLRDLEAATGVNRFGLYDSFKDKEGLFEECVAQYADRAATSLDEMAAQGFDGLLAFLGRFTEPCDAGGHRHGCLVVSSLLERDQLSANAQQRLQEHIAFLLETVRGILVKEQAHGVLRRDLDIDECVAFLHMFFVGLPTMGRIADDPTELHRAARAAVRSLQAWRA